MSIIITIKGGGGREGEAKKPQKNSIFFLTGSVVMVLLNFTLGNRWKIKLYKWWVFHPKEMIKSYNAKISSSCLWKPLRRWFTGLPHVFKIQLSNLLYLSKNSLKIFLLFINLQIKFKIQYIISTSQCVLPHITKAVVRGEKSVQTFSKKKWFLPKCRPLKEPWVF